MRKIWEKIKRFFKNEIIIEVPKEDMTEYKNILTNLCKDELISKMRNLLYEENNLNNVDKIIRKAVLLKEYCDSTKTELKPVNHVYEFSDGKLMSENTDVYFDFYPEFHSTNPYTYSRTELELNGLAIYDFFCKKESAYTEGVVLREGGYFSTFWFNLWETVNMLDTFCYRKHKIRIGYALNDSGRTTRYPLLTENREWIEATAIDKGYKIVRKMYNPNGEPVIAEEYTINSKIKMKKLLIDLYKANCIAKEERTRLSGE